MTVTKVWRHEQPERRTPPREGALARNDPTQDCNIDRTLINGMAQLRRSSYRSDPTVPFLPSRSYRSVPTVPPLLFRSTAPFLPFLS